MAKKSVREIVNIINSDINHNSNLLENHLHPLIIASAHAVSQTTNSKDFLNNPTEYAKTSRKNLESLLAKLYKHRIDYQDVLQDINGQSVDVSSRQYDLRGTEKNLTEAGILARLIGYDLIMISVLHHLYPTVAPDPKPLWTKFSTGEHITLRKLISKYNSEPDNPMPLTGSTAISFHIPNGFK